MIAARLRALRESSKKDLLENVLSIGDCVKPKILKEGSPVSACGSASGSRVGSVSLIGGGDAGGAGGDGDGGLNVSMPLTDKALVTEPQPQRSEASSSMTISTSAQQQNTSMDVDVPASMATSVPSSPSAPQQQNTNMVVDVAESMATSTDDILPIATAQHDTQSAPSQNEPIVRTTEQVSTVVTPSKTSNGNSSKVGGSPTEEYLKDLDPEWE
ncbi:hypothetical protein HDU76_006809 [Blyttiomyces sp. JEL0837]|nr:hypothetical protein HDU76_006809 [Blyttiomyces sp. JEL0837]